MQPSSVHWLLLPIGSSTGVSAAMYAPVSPKARRRSVNSCGERPSDSNSNWHFRIDPGKWTRPVGTASWNLIHCELKFNSNTQPLSKPEPVVDSAFDENISALGRLWIWSALRRGDESRLLRHGLQVSGPINISIVINSNFRCGGDSSDGRFRWHFECALKLMSSFAVNKTVRE